MDKLAVGRAQIGTALDLFIRDRDPVSVHSLAAAGCAVIDGLAEAAGSFRMVDQTVSTNPGMTARQFYELRNQFWNAFKHVSTQSGTVRNDGDLISQFSDFNNDIILFVGWHDYMLLTKRLPVEAQVFQVWWYGVNPSRIDPNAYNPSLELFPGIADVDRREQKRRLARAVEKWRKQREITDADMTEKIALSARVSY